MTPSSSAIPPAIASITSVNEVRAIDRACSSAMDCTAATERLAFTDHTACSTWRRNSSLPVRALRSVKVTLRVTGVNLLAPNVGRSVAYAAVEFQAWRPGGKSASESAGLKAFDVGDRADHREPRQ